MGLPWGGGLQCGPRREKLQMLHGWIPKTGAESISDTVVLFPPRKYTYDLPYPPTQEDETSETDRKS